jgi:hypothetical protein
VFARFFCCKKNILKKLKKSVDSLKNTKHELMTIADLLDKLVEQDSVM